MAITKVTSKVLEAAQPNITSVGTLTGLNVNVGTNNVGAIFESTDQQLILALDDSLKTTTIESNNGILIFGTNGASGGTSATEAMRIDRNGNVGIGGSPDTQLNIKNGDDAVVRIESIGSESGDDARLELKTTNGTFTIQNDRSLGTSGALTFAGNTSNNIVIDHNSGNVGIGTSSPAASLSILSSQDASTDVRHYASFGADATFDDTDVKNLYGAGIGEVQIKNGTSARCGILALGGSLSAGEALGAIAFYRSGNTDGYRHRATIQGGVTSSGTANQHGGNLVFRTAADDAASPSERMRIDSSGNLLVGTTTVTSVGKLQLTSSSTFYGFVDRAQVSTGNPAGFFNQAGGLVGGISTNSTSTTFVTSSDYRLKENVDYEFNALDRVAQLKPARFNFIADETNTLVDGFLAHEVQDIVPEAIVGEKDAVDDEGNPEYQGIDQSKLVPLLTKAIQEQQTIIDDLKTRIETLENA